MIDIFYDSYRVLTKVYSEGAFLKQALSDTFIEEKNRAHTTKICYGVLDRDIALDYDMNYLCDKRPKLAVRTVLKIAMYSLKYLRSAPYCVCDNAVELLKKLGKGGTAGFANAFLRKYIKTEIPLPVDKYERFSVTWSYPLFAVKRLMKDYGEEIASRIAEEGKERTLVRFFPGTDGEKYLADRRWEFEKTPFENCFFVRGFKRNEDYDRGVYTFQSIGSAAIVDAVIDGKDRSSETILDACAAPGGKSVALSFAFSSVTACELHAHRVNLIGEYVSRTGRENVTALQADSSRFRKEFENKFDVVLTDVPCSGFGVVSDNPDIKRNRTDADVTELTKLQLSVLENCSRYVKPGGELVYSTCSVFRAENDGVAEAFLRGHETFEEIPCESPLAHLRFGHGMTFLPYLSEGAGFYVCKFRRKQ